VPKHRWISKRVKLTLWITGVLVVALLAFSLITRNSFRREQLERSIYSSISAMQYFVSASRQIDVFVDYSMVTRTFSDLGLFQLVWGGDDFQFWAVYSTEAEAGIDLSEFSPDHVRVRGSGDDRSVWIVVPEASLAEGSIEMNLTSTIFINLGEETSEDLSDDVRALAGNRITSLKQSDLLDRAEEEFAIWIIELLSSKPFEVPRENIHVSFSKELDAVQSQRFP